MSGNNDYLSQEEIDALLRHSSDPSDSDSQSTGAALRIEDYLSELEQDALGEIGNITFGSSATALSTLLGQKVDITTPTVSIIKREDLVDQFPHPHVAVHVRFIDGFQGINLLVIKTKDAQVIADLMLGGDGTNVAGELSEIHISAVQEAMNQMMGSAATSMSTIFNRMVNITPPGIDILDVAKQEGTTSIPEEHALITISFRLKIGDLIDSSIMQMLTVSFAKDMVDSLIGGAQSAPSEPPVKAKNEEKILSQAELDALTSQMQSPPPRAPEPSPTYQQPVAPPPPPPPVRQVNVQPVEYANFGGDTSVSASDVNLNLLMDIPLKVTVELGRTRKVIKDILEFTQGSIIELDKLAGEPVDILVNDKLIAKGEVVVIDENFGVRVTDIISQFDRIQRIQ